MRDELINTLRALCCSAEAMADSMDTLPSTETMGDPKRHLPGNMFLAVGDSDVRQDIADAKKILERHTN